MIGLELIKNNIEQDIQKQLNRIGILYRLHSGAHCTPSYVFF